MILEDIAHEIDQLPKEYCESGCHEVPRVLKLIAQKIEWWLPGTMGRGKYRVIL